MADLTLTTEISSPTIDTANAKIVNLNPEYGSVNQIAIENAGSLTRPEQLALITSVITKPLSEIQEKTQHIQCMVLFGSQVSTEENIVPNDVDTILLTDGRRFDENVELTPDAQNLWNILKEIDPSRGGRIQFTISGDTITRDHTLELTIKSTSVFLKSYNATGGERQGYLEEQRKLMQASFPDKAVKYANFDKTFSETVAETGVILFGRNIVDRDGQEVFKTK